MTSRLLPLACAALLLTACSGDDGDAERAGLVSRPGVERSATGAPAPSASPTGPAAAPTPRPSRASSAAPAATAAPAPPRTSEPPPDDERPYVVAAGSYAYDVRGTVTAGTSRPVEGTSTLTVEPVAGGEQRSVREGEQGRTEQAVVSGTDGAYLSSYSLTNPAFSKQFRPEPPVLLAPMRTPAGRTWSWSMTSTDGATTARAAHRVLRDEVVVVGGERVACVVVQTDLVLSGDVDYRGRTTTWLSRRYALPVREAARGEGTVSGFPFSTDTTSTLRSVRPS